MGIGSKLGAVKTAHFVLDGELGSLMLHRKTGRDFQYAFSGPQSVKHLIESLGIPHTELGNIEANGSAVTTSYLVQDGDLVEVSASTPSLQVADEPRFILDGHLGRLTSRLRMLGLDCLYHRDYTDADLARTSVEDLRILLTRDRRLLMRKSISKGYLVRSLLPAEQILEVVRRFQLRQWMKPFFRCIRCNHPLQPVRKEDVLDRLQPLTRRYFEEFRICPACSQIYWRGSHFDRMQSIVADLAHRADG